MALGENTEEKCKIWFMAYGIVNYCQHENLVNNIVDPKKLKKTKKREPLTSCFSKIKKEDKIIEYDVQLGYITGIFKVSDYMQYCSNDDSLLDSMVFPVQKVTPNKFLDFDRYIENSKVDISKDLKEFIQRLKKNATLEALEFHKEICFKLENETDFKNIKQGFNKPQFLIDSYNTVNRETRNKEKFTGWQSKHPEALSAILDFYNSRATSFVSLFVAAVFGLVSISAISQIIWTNLPIDTGYWALFCASSFIFVTFVAAGHYTLTTYFQYADIASKVKGAIQFPFYDDLNKIKISVPVNNVHKKVGLSDFLCKKETEISLQEPRHFIHNNSQFFKIIYVAVMVLLFTVVHWQPLTQVVKALHSQFVFPTLILLCMVSITIYLVIYLVIRKYIL